MIAIENLHVQIDGNDILKGLHLHLNTGDSYALLGPNGAGKSTTIFTLLGLRAYQSGQIRIMGDDPALNAVHIRRLVGIIPENAGFYGWMSASTYLEWYGRLFQLPITEHHICRLLEKVGLGEEKDRIIGTYSRGMKQRLALARAFLPHPKLLILDEPTNGLDPKGRHEIHDLLAEVVNEGTGLLLCTHLLDDVERLCNRIGIIDNGRTRLEGFVYELMMAHGDGQRYRLRLETSPDATGLPNGMTMLGHENGWWHVGVQAATPQQVADLWSELWRRGWHILEIRSEASTLEELYMSHTGQNQALPQEKFL